MIRKSRNQHS